VADRKKTGPAAPKPKKAKARPAAKPKPAAKAKPEPAAAAAPVVPEARPATAAPGVAAASPLEGRPGSAAETAVIVEHPHTGKIDLRGDSGNRAFLDAVRGATGAAPPSDANTVATAGRNEILWLGPDEWLVVTPMDGQGAMESGLNQALAGQHVSIVDTTDARTVIRIHGAHARDVLMKGCPLDLHPRAFGAGQCAQTVIAKADVLIHQRDDAPTYDIYVLCSFARYLWDWLADAAREFS
jgi:sarcosine oxidase subunit gamma